MPKLLDASLKEDWDRIKILIEKFPVRYKMTKGAAHWTAGQRDRPSQHDIDSYDFVVDGLLNVYVNPRLPGTSVKAHTWRQNTGNLGISLAGMAGSGIHTGSWKAHAFDTTKFRHMVTKEQFEYMAWLFAFFSIWYYIPVDNIMTHEEYARIKNFYPGYPNGYYPERWDLDGYGPSLRDKVRYYKIRISEVFLKKGVKI